MLEIGDSAPDFVLISDEGKEVKRWPEEDILAVLRKGRLAYARTS